MDDNRIEGEIEVGGEKKVKTGLRKEGGREETGIYGRLDNGKPVGS